jgi:hypothetical protein
MKSIDGGGSYAGFAESVGMNEPYADGRGGCAKFFTSIYVIKLKGNSKKFGITYLNICTYSSRIASPSPTL